MHLESGSIISHQSTFLPKLQSSRLPPMNPMGAGIMRSQNTGLSVTKGMIDPSLRARGSRSIFFSLACIRSGYRHSPIAIVGGKRGLSILGNHPVHVRFKFVGFVGLAWPIATTTNFWSEKKKTIRPSPMTIFSKK